MTDESIAVEFEAYLCVGGEKMKTCPICKLETFQRKCPICRKGELTGDALIDSVFEDIENGKEVDMNVLRKSQKELAEEFEPVIPGARQ
jgi:hypothetical protein